MWRRPDIAGKANIAFNRFCAVAHNENKSLRPFRMFHFRAGVSVMKPSKIRNWLLASVVAAGISGCATSVSRLGEGQGALEVGKQYTMKRDAILFINRGRIDSIENPDLKIEDYERKSYESYYRFPVGVLRAGTVLQVITLKIEENRFAAIGKVKTGEFKHASEGPYAEGRKSFRTVLLNDLCGGDSFDQATCALNLEKHSD